MGLARVLQQGVSPVASVIRSSGTPRATAYATVAVTGLAIIVGAASSIAGLFRAGGPAGGADHSAAGRDGARGPG